MRTKTLLIAAAALAAGTIASQAQSNVYSANVVGYVNLTLKPGYNLITAQLVNTAAPTAPINTILTNAPDLVDGSTYLSWNPTLQDFSPPANWVSPASGGPLWVGADFETPVTSTAPLGSSFFVFNNGADAKLTLIGEVPQGTKVVTVPALFGFVADVPPVSQEIATNGFPVVDGSTLSTFDPVLQDYSTPINGVGPSSGGPMWVGADFETPVPFAPEVGQGLLYNNPGSQVNWNRVFTLQ